MDFAIKRQDKIVPLQSQNPKFTDEIIQARAERRTFALSTQVDYGPKDQVSETEYVADSDRGYQQFFRTIGGKSGKGQLLSEAVRFRNISQAKAAAALDIQQRPKRQDFFNLTLEGEKDDRLINIHQYYSNSNGQYDMYNDGPKGYYGPGFYLPAGQSPGLVGVSGSGPIARGILRGAVGAEQPIFRNEQNQFSAIPRVQSSYVNNFWRERRLRDERVIELEKATTSNQLNSLIKG